MSAIGSSRKVGKCTDCESTWLPECRRRSNIIHKGGNTRTVAVVPSLKRLSTRRALGWGRVSRLVTMYCEDLSLWKARRDFLPLMPENPPRVSSRESRSFTSIAIHNPPSVARHCISSVSANEFAPIARPGFDSKCVEIWERNAFGNWYLHSTLVMSRSRPRWE